MEHVIDEYWRKLSGTCSAGQVFFRLAYLTLLAYAGRGRTEPVPMNAMEWRAALPDWLPKGEERAAAERLGTRIEWEVLVQDEAAVELLGQYIRGLAQAFSQEGECTELLDQVMAELFRLAEIQGLYVTTPESIRQLAVGMLDGLFVRTMADFCCAAGGLGIAVWHCLAAPGATSYSGLDLDPALCDVNCLMAYAHGIPERNVQLCDVLRMETAGQGRYDLILVDIPRGRNKNLSMAEYGRFGMDVAARRSIFADWLYILRAIDTLTEAGRAFLVTTTGTLVRKNESDIRRFLVEQDWVEAVLTLPPNLYPSTRLGTEILILNKKKEERRQGRILFADISGEYYRQNRNCYAVTEESLTRTILLFDSFREEDCVSVVIDVSDIETETYSLKPLLYLRGQVQEKEEQEWIALGDVARIVRGVQLKKEEEDALCGHGTARYLNIKDLRDGQICYDEARTILPKNSSWHEKFQVRPNDLLITSKGTTFKFAVVDESPPEAFICGNLTRIQVDEEKYHPYVLLEYLRSAQGMRELESIQSGTTIRVLNNANLERMRIPRYDRSVMQQVGERLKKCRQAYEEGIRAVTEEYETERKELLGMLEAEPSAQGKE